MNFGFSRAGIGLDIGGVDLPAISLGGEAGPLIDLGGLDLSSLDLGGKLHTNLELKVPKRRDKLFCSQVVLVGSISPALASVAVRADLEWILGVWSSQA